MASASQLHAPIPNKLPEETKTKTLEQWKTEHETISDLIKSIELQIEQLPMESSSITPPELDGILTDFYSLGLKLFQVEPIEEGFIPATATPIITKTLINISAKSKDVDSSDDTPDDIDPVNNSPLEVTEAIDSMVQSVFMLYDRPGDITYLNGNYSPISGETPPTSDLIVEHGTIPETLNGMMLRNGPNPTFEAEGNYMWMDGNSMIHGIRFNKGKATTYVARYTRTARYVQEAKYEKSQLIKYGDLVGRYGVFVALVEKLRRRLDVLDSRFGITTANDGLVYHAGRIMAEEDFGKPYVIYVTEEGDLETVGVNNYTGKLDHWISPHPKIDPVTGEMFTLGSLRETPYCIYRVISKEGVMGARVPIKVRGPTYNHELCITENYVIFQDLCLVYDPEKMETTKTEWIFNFDGTKMSRYGILPRYAKSDKKIQWFELDEPFFVFHNANAWEEDDDTIVLYSCVMKAKIHELTKRPYIAPYMFQRFNINIINGGFEPTVPELYKITFNMRDTTVKKERVWSGSDYHSQKNDMLNSELMQEKRVFGDFPKINQKYCGRKTQFVYISEVNGANKIISVVKYDLKDKHSNPTWFKFGSKDNPKIYGSGEVVFVQNTDSSTAAEDDGYLITFVHQELHLLYNALEESHSHVYVIDAKKMECVAKILLPTRVPYGFHAIYVTEEELQKQIKPSTMDLNPFE